MSLLWDPSRDTLYLNRDYIRKGVITSKTLLLKEAKMISSAEALDMYLIPAKLHMQQLSSVTIEFFGLK